MIVVSPSSQKPRVLPWLTSTDGRITPNRTLAGGGGRGTEPGQFIRIPRNRVATLGVVLLPTATQAVLRERM